MLNFDPISGLIAAVAQDADTGQVLMVAWMNAEAFEETLRSGYATYYSRSRRKLWRKGDESGHIQRVMEIRVDCDADCVLLKVLQTGAACHEGYRSCFFRVYENGTWRVVETRVADPGHVYRSSRDDT